MTTPPVSKHTRTYPEVDFGFFFFEKHLLCNFYWVAEGCVFVKERETGGGGEKKWNNRRARNLFARRKSCNECVQVEKLLQVRIWKNTFVFYFHFFLPPFFFVHLFFTLSFCDYRVGVTPIIWFSRSIFSHMRLQSRRILAECFSSRSVSLVSNPSLRFIHYIIVVEEVCDGNVCRRVNCR